MEGEIRRVLEAHQVQAVASHRKLEAEEADRRQLSGRRKRDWQVERTVLEAEICRIIDVHQTASQETEERVESWQMEQQQRSARRNEAWHGERRWLQGQIHTALEAQQIRLEELREQEADKLALADLKRSQLSEELAAQRCHTQVRIAELVALRSEDVLEVELRAEDREQSLQQAGRRHCEEWEAQRWILEAEIRRVASSHQQAAALAQGRWRREEAGWSAHFEQREEEWAADWHKLHGLIRPLLHDREVVESELLSRQLAAEEGMTLFRQFAELQEEQRFETRP
ncbi:unnamed protein product [Polarella glacialis]|uniref:Uncharacterized protein n=1 Tax=Polarella glacialis TaxID=89957 RepID=A0A813HVD6_POLGL|nr:unnamed protein product [Polarella glacialis]